MLANRTDLDQLIQRVHAPHYAEVATEHLRLTRPEALRAPCLHGRAEGARGRGGARVVVCVVISPMTTLVALVALCSLFYLAVSATSSA